MQKAFLAAVASILIAGCAGYKPPTTEEALFYPSIAEMINSRYWGMTLRYYVAGTQLDRYLLSFKVLATEEELLLEKRKLVADLYVYCDARGGELKDLKDDNDLKLEDLKRQYTYEEESRVVFECGPKGRGKKLTDWEKFNPLKCRKLKEKKVDMNKVLAEYGNPPGFACFKTGLKGTGIAFMGSLNDEKLADGYYVNMKINEQKKDIIPLSELINLK